MGKHTQQEHHKELGQPGHAVKELEHLPLLGKGGRIADEDGRHIQGQQAVAPHQGTEAVGKESQAEHQNTGERAGGEVELGEDPFGKAAHQIAHQESHGQLVDKDQDHGQAGGPFGKVEGG